MLAAIANILKQSIGQENWIERYTGLVLPMTRPEYKKSLTGAQVPDGTKVYPIGYDVNAEQCWDDGTYKKFSPNSSMASVAFFVDRGGVSLSGTLGPDEQRLAFTFNIGFRCWLNLRRLGVTQPNYSALAAPTIISKVYGKKIVSGMFAGGLEEQIYRNVRVTDAVQLPKSPDMFEPFYFAQEGNKRGLFMYPYDYFGIDFRGTFEVPRNCLPDLFPAPFEFTDPTCVAP